MLSEEETRELIVRIDKKLNSLKQQRTEKIRKAEQEKFEIETGKKEVDFPGTRIETLSCVGMGDDAQIHGLEVLKGHLLFVLGEEELPESGLLM